MKRMRLAVSVLGPLWLFLLYAAPYILANPQGVPPLDPAYAYASAGMLVGIALVVLLKDRIPAKPFCWAGLAGFSLGFLMALVLLLPEFYCYQLCMFSGSEWDVSQLRSLSLVGCAVADLIEWIGSSELMHDLLMFANGVLASWSWLAISFSCDMSLDDDFGEVAPSDSCRFARVVAFVGALVFFVGFLRPGVWSAFAGAVVDREWLESAPSLYDLLPGFTYMGICAASCSLVWNLADATRARDVREAGCLQWMLASYPLGQLLWNLVSRCTDVPIFFNELAGIEKPVVFLLTAANAATLIYLIAHVRRGCVSKEASKEASKERVGCSLSREERNETTDECKPLNNETHALRCFFEKKDMTQREIQAAVLTLDGKKSGDVAEELGLKSPTVRNYLQRSYKKLDVGNIAELRTLLESEGLVSKIQGGESLGVAADSAVDTNDSVAVVDSANEHRECTIKKLEKIELLALLFVMTTLCFHLYLRADSWIVLHSVSLGLGIGVVALGVSLLLKDSFGFCGESSGSRVIESADCFVFGVFALALIAAQSNQADFFWDQALYEPVCMCIGTAVCSFAALRMTLRVVKRHREHRARMNLVFPVTVIVAGIVLCGVSVKAWAACCLIVLLVILVAGLGATFLAPSCKALVFGVASREVRSLFLPVFVAAFALGIVAVEVLRGASNAFALVVQMAFLVVAIGIVSWKQAGAGDWSRAAAFSSVLLVCVACMASLEIALVLVLFLLIGIAAIQRRGEFSEDVHLCAGALGFGVGAITGCLLIDKWRDLIQLNHYAMEEYGGEVAAYLTIPSAVLMAAIIGLVAFWYVISLDGMPAQGEEERQLAARMKLYMQSQGLSEPESEVLSQIALGLTGMQIAHRTHYSYGAVNTMRTEGYRKLGVHSKSELSHCLGKNVVVAD